MTQIAALVKISEVSKKYNITKRTLRYYEEIGLIKSIRNGASQCRYFDEDGINRIEQILLLRSVNFSIDEISTVLRSEDANRVFEIFLSRLNQIDEKINELEYSKLIITSFIDIGRNIGINNVNIYQLLRDQIFIHSNDERMINMGKGYEGDIVRLEIGLGIVPYIKSKDSEGFLSMIKNMRKRLEGELEKDIPLIRVTDNAELKELQYKISIKGKNFINNTFQPFSDDTKLEEILCSLESTIRDNIDDITIKIH